MPKGVLLDVALHRMNNNVVQELLGDTVGGVPRGAGDSSADMIDLTGGDGDGEQQQVCAPLGRPPPPPSTWPAGWPGRAVLGRYPGHTSTYTGCRPRRTIINSTARSTCLLCPDGPRRAAPRARSACSARRWSRRSAARSHPSARTWTPAWPSTGPSPSSQNPFAPRSVRRPLFF